MSSSLKLRTLRISLYTLGLATFALYSIERIGSVSISSLNPRLGEAGFENVPSCPGALPLPSEEEPFPIRYKLTEGMVTTFQIDMWERCEASFAGYMERFPGKFVFQLTTSEHITATRKVEDIVLCDCPHSFRYSFDGEIGPNDQVLLIHRGNRIVVNADEF